jgi:osmotically inducible lipoprotein OsmB
MVASMNAKFHTTALCAVFGLSLMALSGCGQTPGCRALTGAGVGAAGGAVVGAIGGNPLLGAGAGALAGGAAGALTSPNQVNGPSPCH